MKVILSLFLITIIFPFTVSGQDPHRFDNDIQKFSSLPTPESGSVVFTGSSSIRFWDDLKTDCHGEVINTGFGGSHMSDLLFFLDETILRFRPSEIFIYEGDNDISAEKSPDEILETTKQVVDRILENNVDVKINLISPKPSPARWQFKDQYLAFNALLKSYCESHDQLAYIDVWYPMLNDQGRPKPEIFISDSLHMNRQGYLLWKEVICGKSD